MEEMYKVMKGTEKMNTDFFLIELEGIKHNYHVDDWKKEVLRRK